MRIRRFHGRTSTEAMARMKAALGPDALLLGSEAGIGGGVEILAAVDLDPNPDAAAATGRKAGRTAPPSTDTTELRAELRGLTGRIEQVRSAILEMASLAGVQVAPRTRVLVGAPGSGKTTAAARLIVRHLVESGREDALLITLDQRKIGAREEARAWARTLRVELGEPADGRELSHMLDSATASLIVIDTPGIDPAHDMESLLAAAGEPLCVTAVVRATDSRGALARGWVDLARLRPADAMLTHLDAIDGPAEALAWLETVGLGVSWLARGRSIVEGLEAAGPGTLIDRSWAA